MMIAQKSEETVLSECSSASEELAGGQVVESDSGIHHPNTPNAGIQNIPGVQSHFSGHGSGLRSS